MSGFKCEFWHLPLSSDIFLNPVWIKVNNWCSTMSCFDHFSYMTYTRMIHKCTAIKIFGLKQRSNWALFLIFYNSEIMIYIYDLYSNVCFIHFSVYIPFKYCCAFMNCICCSLLEKISLSAKILSIFIKCRTYNNNPELSLRRQNL